MMITRDINENVYRKTIEKINGIKCLFEKIKNIYKPLAISTTRDINKKKRQRMRKMDDRRMC